MSQREAADFGPLPRDDGPVFDAPWQAEVLALAFALAGRGLVSPAQWSRALGAAHRRLIADGAPDVADTYYRAALAALERLVADSRMLTGAQVETRTEEWRRAYLRTPHGRPVHLAAGRDP